MRGLYWFESWADIDFSTGGVPDLFEQGVPNLTVYIPPKQVEISKVDIMLYTMRGLYKFEPWADIDFLTGGSIFFTWCPEAPCIYLSVRSDIVWMRGTKIGPVSSQGGSESDYAQGGPATGRLELALIPEEPP